SLRVTIANDNSAIANWGFAAIGAAPPTGSQYISALGSGATGGLLVGLTACDSDKVINFSSTTNQLMVTGVSGRKVHICAIDIGPIPTATNLALVEGTTTTNPCDTSTAGVAGGTTAATGWNIGANGGLTIGSGLGIVMSTATTGNNLCLIAS